MIHRGTLLLLCTGTLFIYAVEEFTTAVLQGPIVYYILYSMTTGVPSDRQLLMKDFFVLLAGTCGSGRQGSDGCGRHVSDGCGLHG